MKNLIRWLVGIVCGLFLVFQVAVHIPFVQRMLGDVTASSLKDAFGWDVSIGRIRFGMWNRVIIDDLYLRDQQDSTILYASRLAAKINLLPLAKGQVSIANVQLIGTHINIYQSTPQSKPNFQFLIDTFSSNDTTSSSLNLHIGSILLRRVSVDWHQHWKSRKNSGNLDPAHLQIKDLAITAHLRTLTNDSLNLSLKRLSFTEESGISLNNLSFDLIVGKKGAFLNNFSLRLPNSYISIHSAQTSWPHFPQKGQIDPWLKNVSVIANISLRLVPSDLSALTPWLRHIDTPVDMRTTLLFSEGCLNIPTLNLLGNKSIRLSAQAFVYDIIGTPEYTITLEQLHANSAALSDYTLTDLPAVKKITPIILRLNSIDISGRLHASQHKQEATLHINNKFGNINIKASAQDWNNIDACVSSKGLAINEILSDKGHHAIGDVSFNITAKGLIKDFNGKPDIGIHAFLPLLQWQKRDYNDIDIYAHLCDKSIETKFNLQDHDGNIQSRLTWTRGNRHKLRGYASINAFLAERLGLGKRYPNTLLSINTAINLSGNNIDNIVGSVNISNLLIQDIGIQHSPTIGLENMSIATDISQGGYRTLNVSSVPLNITAEGCFKFSTLARTITNGMHNKLPRLIPNISTPFKADTLQFSFNFQDTALIRRITLQDISIPRRATLEGSMYGYDSILVRGDIPELHIGSELLRNSKINIHGTSTEAKVIASTDRRHKKGFVALSLSANAHDDRLRVIASLDNNRQPLISGEIDVTTTFSLDSDGKMTARAWVAPSNFIISDTIWKVQPCNITWNGRVADIRGFNINQSAHRGININGRISASTKDTLNVKFNGINTEYILDLVNFKAVEFQGQATGNVYATKLLSSPNASINLTVNNFAFNSAPLGTLRAKANWGSTPHFLDLEATISDPEAHHLSTINGGFHIGNKKTPNGLDLRVNTQRFNLAFLNYFTKGILQNFQGRASGYCRIYGPFKTIDLEGDMILNHADFSLPVLGTSYHLQNDSVHIRPEEISIIGLLHDKNAIQFDQPFAAYAHTGKSEVPHTAVVHGRLAHKHFKGMNYDFRVNANKFLGYDFKEFGESSFYATCIVSGNINVQGMPGRLTVNVNATPEQGTTFTYNVATPGGLTNADFITINSINEDTLDSSQNGNPMKYAGTNTNAQATASTNSDMYLDFDLPITPDAKIRLLMDRKSGDMIEINGNGRIRAKYYNKGRFNIFGTYHVQGGTYRMSLQDIIRKEFKFQPNGTIIFSGDAMKADLNLKAVYSVNSVSLDDLTTSSLGFSKTKVDCIMNLTGHPEQPIITFDFDLPNATEDERQIVRSIVSTEEERDMQAIYLLGLGRFYNSSADGSTQSSAAMNSLVSSTLSSHLNNLITTAVGSSNWQISTYLQTTEDGWSNMDAEGQLSGSLFNNRLLLTGNFGYREKYYTQRNFISDVSIEYLLTRNGSLSIKAYNQANDRYFVQSSLNTQGIGLQYKKDFNNFLDLFKWLRPKKKKEQKQEDNPKNE